MYDNIRLKVFPLVKGVDLSKKLEYIHHYDTNTYEGYIKNIRIFQNLNGITIYGSISKYLQGENITPLSRAKAQQALEKLEYDIGYSLEKAIVCSVEFGTSVILKEKPSKYLNLFGHTKKLTRVEYSKYTGVETITYTSPTGSFSFTGYDKIKEMHKRKQCAPRLFYDSNVLRLEYKIKKRKGIKEKFNRDLTAYELYHEDVYQTFQILFLEAYQEIRKMERSVYINKSERITPAKIRVSLAEQYRQDNFKNYHCILQQLKESGGLSSRNLERIRAEDRKMSKDIYISEENALIKELDTFLFMIMTLE